MKNYWKYFITFLLQINKVSALLYICVVLYCSGSIANFFLRIDINSIAIMFLKSIAINSIATMFFKSIAIMIWYNALKFFVLTINNRKLQEQL